MPNISIVAGTFTNIYVGDYPSGVLEDLTEITTGDQNFSFDVAETHSYKIGNSLQSGPAVVKVTSSFISDNPNTIKLTMGNPLSTLVQDASSSFNLYTVLLTHPIGDDPRSILINKCRTTKSTSIPYSKNSVTVVDVEFTHQEFNRSIQQFYKRDLDTLDSILGVRSPL